MKIVVMTIKAFGRHLTTPETLPRSTCWLPPELLTVTSGWKERWAMYSQYIDIAFSVISNLASSTHWPLHFDNNTSSSSIAAPLLAAIPSKASRFNHRSCFCPLLSLLVIFDQCISSFDKSLLDRLLLKSLRKPLRIFFYISAASILSAKNFRRIGFHLFNVLSSSMCLYHLSKASGNLLTDIIIKLNFSIVDTNTAILVYQVHEFLNTGYRFDDTAPKLIRNAATAIVNRIIRPVSENSTRIWPSDWALNRSSFRRAFKKLFKALPHIEPSASISPERLTSRFTSISSGSSAIIEEIPRDMATIPSPPGMDQNTWNQIQAVIQASIAALPSQRGLQGDPGSQGPSGIDGGNGSQPRQFKTAEDIDYFDPGYEDADNAFIVTAGKHVFYRDVYVFVNRLKNLVKSIMLNATNRVRELISFCFRGEALIWYFIELDDVVRDMLRDVSLDHWYASLIKRFKKRISMTLQVMQAKKYTLSNARNGRIFRVYVQEILRHAKAAEFESTYNQLMMAWNNLNIDFRAQISESKPNTSLKDFLKFLNEKVNIWQQMTTRREPAMESNFDMKSNFDRSSRPPISKSRSKLSDRQVGGGFNDYDDYDFRSFADRYVLQFSFYSRYTFYQYQNFAYQGYQQQYGNQQQYDNQQPYRQPFNFGQSQRQSVSAVLSNARQLLQIIFGNVNLAEFVSRKRSSQSMFRNQGRNDGRFGNKGKSRAYVTNEVDEEEFEDHDQTDENDHHDHDEDYYIENYYLDNHEIHDQDDYGMALYTSEDQLQCRQCKLTFEFNNLLHKHLRQSFTCLRKAFKPMTLMIIRTDRDLQKPSADIIKKLSANTSVNPSAEPSPTFSTGATKNSSTAVSSLTESPIKHSKVDPGPDIKTDYGFRSWSHAKAEIALSEIAEPRMGCLNIEAEPTIIDRPFLKEQAFNAHIRIMATPLIVRGLGIIKHRINEYALILIYIYGKDDVIDERVRACFIREVHIVDDLKVNILIGNDIGGSEDIIVFIGGRTAHIGSCGVTVSLEVRTIGAVVAKSVHLRKTIVISSRAELSVKIHHLIVLNKEYLFESEEILNLTAYAHLVDASIKAVLLRNESDIPVQVPRNYRLGRITEMNYINAFHIFDDDDEVRDLAAKRSRSSKQKSWFKTVMVGIATVFVAVASTGLQKSFADILQKFFADILQKSFADIIISVDISETVLSNGVIIYNPDDTNTVRSLSQVVDVFPNLWKDIGFAVMDQDQWMRIFLKSDWKSRISEKVKVYSLGLRDRKLVDETFDEFHRTGKLSWTIESIFFNYFLFCVWKNTADDKKKWVVINIRGLNAITQSNVYSLFLQSNII